MSLTSVLWFSFQRHAHLAATLLALTIALPGWVAQSKADTATAVPFMRFQLDLREQRDGKVATTTTRHLYSADPDEAAGITKYAGWRAIGNVGFVFRRPVVGSIPLYRFSKYEDASGAAFGQHYFYTTNFNEGRQAVKDAHYNDEGVAAYVAATQLPGTLPLYRLYLPQAALHVYTSDTDERNRLIYSSGYTLEGIEGYVWVSAATLPTQ